MKYACGPNCDVKSATYPFEHPEECEDFWSRTSAWLFQAIHVIKDYQRDPPPYVPFSEWARVGAFEFLKKRGIPALGGMDVVVSTWSPDGASCRDGIRKAIDDVAAEGGELDIVYDDPLVIGGVPGKVPVEGLIPCPYDDLIAHISTATREIHERGRRAIWCDASPMFAPSFVVKAVRDSYERHGHLVDGFTWDCWYRDIRAYKARLEAANAELRRMGINEIHGTAIGWGDLYSQQDFAVRCREYIDWWRTVKGLTHIDVVSWVTLKDQGDALSTNNVARTIPDFMPPSDPTSHYALMNYASSRS